MILEMELWQLDANGQKQRNVLWEPKSYYVLPPGDYIITFNFLHPEPGKVLIKEYKIDFQTIVGGMTVPSSDRFTPADNEGFLEFTFPEGIQSNVECIDYYFTVNSGPPAFVEYKPSVYYGLDDIQNLPEKPHDRFNMIYVVAGKAYFSPPKLVCTPFPGSTDKFLLSISLKNNNKKQDDFKISGFPADDLISISEYGEDTGRVVQIPEIDRNTYEVNFQALKPNEEANILLTVEKKVDKAWEDVLGDGNWRLTLTIRSMGNASPIRLIAMVRNFSKVDASYQIDEQCHFILNIAKTYGSPGKIVLDSIWFQIPKDPTIDPGSIFKTNKIRFCEELLNAEFKEYFYIIEQDREILLGTIPGALSTIDLSTVSVPWLLADDQLKLTYHYDDYYVEEVEIKYLS